MATRGHIPFDGHSIQSPGMLRHIPYPGVVPAPNHHSLDPLPPVEILEKKMAIQATEMEQLARENQRLAATHVTLRRDLVATQQEMHRVQTRMGDIHTESDIKIKTLLENIAKMEADLRVGENLKKDLQEAHLEAKAVVKARQELNAEIEKVTQELKKARSDLNNLPEIHAELDSLRQEHQRLRAQFEYEKGLNMEQVEQMHAMERNLISMAREVEKLQAEVVNAEKRVHAAIQYGGGTYGSPDPGRPHSTTSGGPGGYMDAYGRPPLHMNNGSSVDAYGRPQVPASGVSEEGYGRPPPGAQMTGVPPEAYGRPQAQMNSGKPGEGYGMFQAPVSGGVPVEAYGSRAHHMVAGGEVPVEGMSPYGGNGGPAAGGTWTGPYHAPATAAHPPPAAAAAGAAAAAAAPPQR